MCRQRETVPSEVVRVSIDELDALSGEGKTRNPDVHSAEVCCTDSEGTDGTGEEGGELHGG